MRRLTLFVWLLFDAVTLYQAKDPRLCATTDSQSVCPPTTMCSAIDANNDEGTCKCLNRTLTFNPNFTSDNDYCIYVKSTNANDNASNATNKTDTVDDPNAASSSSTEPLPSIDMGKNGRALPGTHHIVAGILIPIVFVFIVTGTVFIYKKLHITHRVRNIRRTRRNRPFYEDVMLGNNDNDDPPLINF